MTGRTGVPRFTGGVVAVVALTLAAACASTSFDRHFDAGRFDVAVAVFAADSSLHSDERTLFRAALAHATPDQAAYAPERARTLLEELLRRYPSGAYHHQARALAGTLERAQQQESVAARIETELAALRTRLVSLEQRVRVQEALHEELSSGTVALRDTLERVQLRLRVREGQLRALQDELRGLKQIDLGPIAPDTTS